MCWAQEPGNLIRTPPGYHASLMSVAHHPSSRETLFHSRPDTSPAPGRPAAFAFFFPSGMPPEIFGGSLMSGMAADDQWRGFPRQCHLTVPANAPREPRCQSYYWLYCSFSHSPDHRSLSSFHASYAPAKPRAAASITSPHLHAFPNLLYSQATRSTIMARFLEPFVSTPK